MSAEADRLTFAKLVLVPETVAEVRVVDVPRVDIVCGWFDTPERLAKALADADKLNGQGVYVTMNPVTAALLGRRANRLAPVGRRGTATADKEIVARRWLLVDLDAERPTDTSSTEEEHAATLLRAAQVRVALGEEGWPEPVFTDSGNGAHLLYRIDEPNDASACDLVKRVLEGLDIRFGGEGVKIDTSVFNAARIVKAAGTTVRKGDSIPERPHRRAHLLSVPDQLQPVPHDHLKATAAMVSLDPNAGSERSYSFGRVALVAFLDAAGIEHDAGRPWSGGTLWRLRQCPFSDAHRDGAFAIQFANGAVVVRCHHESCQGKGWADLREQFPDAARAAVVGAARQGSTRSNKPSRGVASSGPGKAGPNGDGNPAGAPSAETEPSKQAPRATAAEVASAGGDPFSVAAIRQVFDDEAVGLRIDMNDKNPVNDFTDATLAHSLVAYFAGMYAHERFYAFVRHAYEALQDAQMEQFIASVIETRVDPIRATARRVEAVRKLVAVLAHKPDDWTNRTFNAREVVVFSNGVLEIPSLALRPGRPDDHMTMRVNCEWQPDAPAGAIDNFVGLLLQPEEVLPFLEFVGYTMVPGAPSQEKYAILLGAGENGKTRLLLVLAALFEGFTASIPFQDLAKNRFEKSNLYGRMVNLVGDMSAELVEDTSVIKTLSGGDVIHADIKFKRPIEFVNRAKSIISSNELFRANDHTWGFYRRAMIFRFLRDFREGGADGDKRDPAVVDKLLADPNTLPRLAYLGVHAYLRLRQEGRFAESGGMVVAREDFRLANDSVAAFVAEVLIERSGHDLPKEDLYRAFALWTKATGRGTIGEAKFWQRWANTKPAYAGMARARSEGSRVYVVRNVALDPDCKVVVDGREGQAIALTEALTTGATGDGSPRPHGQKRSATCHGCGASLSSDSNPACIRCGWLICAECSACSPSCGAAEARA